MALVQRSAIVTISIEKVVKLFASGPVISICCIGHLLIMETSTFSDHLLNPKDVSAHNFLEVGAAALLVGDMEAKMKGEPWKIFGSSEMPYLDQLLQPSLLTTVTNSVSARAHLRAITALKRSKPGPHQIW